METGPATARGRTRTARRCRGSGTVVHGMGVWNAVSPATRSRSTRSAERLAAARKSGGAEEEDRRGTRGAGREGPGAHSRRLEGVVRAAVQPAGPAALSNQRLESAKFSEDPVPLPLPDRLSLDTRKSLCGSVRARARRRLAHRRCLAVPIFCRTRTLGPKPRNSWPTANSRPLGQRVAGEPFTVQSTSQIWKWIPEPWRPRLI